MSTVSQNDGSRKNECFHGNDIGTESTLAPCTREDITATPKMKNIITYKTQVINSNENKNKENMGKRRL